MRHIESDTMAGVTAGTSFVSGMLHFATVYQPLISWAWALSGIASGIMAIRYYHKLSKRNGNEK